LLPDRRRDSVCKRILGSHRLDDGPEFGNHPNEQSEEEDAMKGLMMDYELTLPPLLQRAEMLFGDKEIVTRLPDKSFHRYTYRDMAQRAKQLAVALQKAGLERGDRVATLCWNHYQHLEAYFGIPCGGFVLHTLNLRLHPSDIAYVAKHAGDRAVIVDRSLLPLLEKFKDETDIEHVFVVEDSYEDLLATAAPDEWEDPRLDERDAAAMCYTSGTTGRCKGVVYTHRSTVLHALGVASISPLGLRVAHDDTLLPVVPMFHANAWGYPYLAAMIGNKLVFPGPYLDPDAPAARREPGPVGPVAHEGDARRRGGRAARADRRLQGAARAQRRPGLGHDGDVARGVRHRLRR
jgi:fatty-acyl-CoA synthase